MCDCKHSWCKGCVEGTTPVKHKPYEWRAIEKNDIRLGTIVRLPWITDSFNIGTICSIHLEDKTYPHFKVARPYAYAHKAFNTNQPLLGAEVITFDANYKKLEVYQGHDSIREMSV